MNSSKDDCRGREASARRLLLGCLLLLLPVSSARADSWQQRASVPGPRAAHSAVWTGQEMIVWGGGVDGSFLNTGARHLPSTDTWRETSPYGAPSPRWFHAAVWTGSEMIVWGGRASFAPSDHFNDGARYNPSTDTWTSISSDGAPISRSQCAAVWTGEEMLVWGGETDGGTPLADGAAYNPATDTWRPINAGSALAPRMEPTAVWTGSEMILFGGVDATQPGWLSYGDGARYNPFTDSWTPLPTTGAPGSRTGHTAVWTGERMIVWGGRDLPTDSRLNDGAIYTPASDSWTGISPYDAPQARMLHAAVWTGTEMIVWGGDAGDLLNTGARYNPATGAWVPTTQANAPGKRMFWRPDLGIWTGRGMLVCAGSDYPASLDSTYLYSLFDPPCPPVIREQPQSLSVAVGSPVTLAVGAEDCEAGAHPTAEQEATGAQAARFEFDTGGREGRLKIAYQFFSVPDSLRVYYEGQRIFDEALSGEETIWVPFGPGQSTHVEIVINEDSGAPNTAWHYTVSFSPPLLRYQWRKNGTALEGETNPTLHFPSVSLEDAADYSVTIANDSSSVVSDAATLTVLPPSSTNCVAVPSGVVAWWRAEGNAEDAVGTNEGTLLYGATFAPGRIGQAFSFDGTGSRVSIPDTDAFRLTQSLSFEGWIQAASWAPGIIFFRGDNRPGLDPYHMSLSASGHLHWGIVAADNQWAAVDAPGVLPIGVWTHVAGVLDGATGELSLYVNGARVSHTTTSLRPLADLDPNSEPALGIGNHGGTFHNFPFHGLIDEGTLYSRALSAAEIAAIFQAGAAGKCSTPPSVCAPSGLVAWWRGDGDAKDVTGAHDGTLLFGTTFSPGVAGQAFTFDLSRARVSIPDSDAFKLTESLSFEGWINVASHAPGIIFIRGDNRGGLDPYHMSIQPSGQLHWGINTAENDFTGLYSPSAVSTGVWMHVAAVLDGATGNMGLYIDGSLVNQTNTNLRPLRDLDPNWEPAVGIGNAGGTFHHFPYHGSVDEWALYSRALSAAEIQGIYNAGAAGKCLGTNPPQPVVVFDVSRDFSATSNPTGPWSYGYAATLGGPFHLLTFAKSFAANNGVPISAWQVSDVLGPTVNRVMGNGVAMSEGGAFTAPSGTVYVWPGNEGAPGLFGVIRFTVPAGGSGIYRIDSAVRPTFDGPVSGDTDFHVLKNGQELFGQFLAPNTGTGYSNIVTLASGDSIDFVVGRGADGSPDHSSLKVHAVISLVTNLPPPPTNQVFDLSTDFSPTSNPGGPWSYGYQASLDGSFNLLTFAKNFASENGVPLFSWQVADNSAPGVARVMGNRTAVSEGGAFTAAPGTVWIAPGYDGSPDPFGVVRFTVPAGRGGHYRLETSVRSNFDGPVSGDSEFHVLDNRQEVFSRFLPPNSATGYTNMLTLEEGDTIDFIVGRGADGLESHSSLRIQAMLTLVTNTPPPPARVFDVSGDFSLAANPNGAWSYGHRTNRLTGGIQLLNTSRTFGAENGVPIDIWQLNNAKPWVAKVIGPATAVSFHFNAPAGTIYFGPDPDATPEDFAVIRFTVPPGAGGGYRLETSVRSLYDNTRSADADFHLVKNGQELFGAVVPPNSATGYSNIVTLAVGDRIDFVAGRGPNALPETGLKIQATLTSETGMAMSIGSTLPLADGGGVRVTGTAPPGSVCRVQRSVNLIDWEDAGSVTATTSGIFEFIDSQPADGPACFYRLRGSDE